jgi:hypothetical protein
MIRWIRALSSNAAGAAAVEFALAIPVLITIIWGMFQLGLIYQADAGMSQALGEAARRATISPTPTDEDIQGMITSRKFGLGNGEWETPEIDSTNIAPADGGYMTISITYTMPTNFLFFPGPDVTLTKEKRIYLSI